MLAIKCGFSFIVISSECDTRITLTAQAKGVWEREWKKPVVFFFIIIIIIIIINIIIIIIILFFAHAQCVSPLCFRGIFPVVGAARKVLS